MTPSYSSIKPVCEGAQDPSMSAAVNNHQLPSYMSGFLYPLGNKKGVYSFVRCVLRTEDWGLEMEKIGIYL